MKTRSTLERFLGSFLTLVGLCDVGGTIFIDSLKYSSVVWSHESSYWQRLRQKIASLTGSPLHPNKNNKRRESLVWSDTSPDIYE